MNSLFEIKGLKFTGMFTQKTTSNTAGFAIFAAVPLFIFSSLLFSTQAFANRPAMDDSGEVNNGEVNNKIETITEVEEINEIVEMRPEAPSSVETMMQQQTRQTGDVVQLPAKEMQLGETLNIKLLDFPRRGMVMNKVQQEYGQPIAISDSIGKPPITHWTYHDRVVYFEYSTVLHVVAR